MEPVLTEAMKQGRSHLLAQLVLRVQLAMAAPLTRKELALQVRAQAPHCPTR